MPRAGSGHRSSGGRSSGSHSSSRSSGGHRASSSRPGSGHSSSFRSGGPANHHSGPSFHSAPPPHRGPGMPPPPAPHRGPGMPPPPPAPHRGPGMPPPPPRRRFRRSYSRAYYGRSHGGSLLSVIVVIILLLVLFAFISRSFSAGSPGKRSASSTSVSTITREKINSSLPFDSNCIVDEIGWFDSVSKTGSRLKTFYDKTGVQPYIVLLQYHPELITDSQKEDYALEYYEDNIDNESTFLYIYFAEDQDDGGGYMCYVNGWDVDSVMDAEAVDIFWEYLDRYWYSNMTADDLFANTFDKTASAIMAKSETPGNSLSGGGFVVIAGIVILCIIIAIIASISVRRKNEREREKEAQRIMNMVTPNPQTASQATPYTNDTNLF